MGFLASTAGGAETHFEIPFPPEVYGVGALVGFVVLLAVTFAFRNVGKRH
jgi:hypothetical protein